MSSHLQGIHHVGIVVSDIKDKSKYYTGVLGYKAQSEVVKEVNQKVLVQFLVLGDSRIELIEPIDKTSPVYNFLQKGGIINHICYETDDIEASIIHLRKKYRTILTYPVNWSTSLNNCKYAFLARPDGEVIELVQFFSKSLLGMGD